MRPASLFRLKRICPGLCLIICALWGICAVLPVSADAERYSLGTIQEDRALAVTAGEQVTTRIGLYNVDGTVPATVEVLPSEAPEGWEVWCGLSVPTQDAAPSSSAPESVTLEVSPSEVLPRKPECDVSSRDAWMLPGRGYVCADVVYVTVVVPDGAPSSDGEMVRVGVMVTWPAGSTQFSQERDIVYEVAVSTATRDDVPRWSVVLPVVLIMVILSVIRGALAKSGKL